MSSIVHAPTSREELQRLEQAMAIGGIAWWEMDCASGAVRFHRRKTDLLGYEPDGFTHYSHFTALLHPDDLEPAMQAMRDHLQGARDEYRIEYRIRARSGAYRWFEDVGRISVRAEGGRPVQVTGIVTDISRRRAIELELRGSEERFRAVFHGHSAACLILDPGDGTIVDANVAAAQLYGWSVDELKRRSIGQINVLPAEQVRDRMAAASERGNARFEFTHRTAAGSTLEVEVDCSRIVVGGRAFLHSIVHDVQDRRTRREAEAALRTTHDRLRRAELFSRFGHWEVSLEDRILHASEGARRVYGLGAASTPLAAIQGQAHAEDRPRLDRALRELIEESRPYDQLFRIRAADDGRLVYVHSRAEYDRARRTVFGVVQDVTEREVAAQALARSEARLRRVLAGSRDGFGDFEAATGRVSVTPRYCEIYGLPAGTTELPIEELAAFVEPADRAVILADRAAISSGAQDEHVWEYRIRRADGSLRWIQSRGKVLGRDATGRPLHVSGAITDITERRAAEEALRDSRRLLQAITEHAPVGIFHADASGRLSLFNPAFLRLTGLSEGALHAPFPTDIVHPDDRARVERERAEAIHASTPYGSEHRHLLPGGEVRWVRVSVVPMYGELGAVSGWVGVIIDLTEARALQAQLARNARLAAMGSVVAGVAHEINNPLAVALSNQSMAREVLTESRARLLRGATSAVTWLPEELETAAGALTDAVAASQRIAAIVKEMSAFTLQTPMRTRLRVDALVASVVEELPAWIGGLASVRIVNESTAELLVSPGRLEQVLVELVDNAAKATPVGARGEIQLRTTSSLEGLVRIEVSDRGVGVEPADLERIFDPFFTTRPVGEWRGAGLGLAVSRSVVLAHGGTLTAESVVGAGSTFRIELPAAPAEG